MKVQITDESGLTRPYISKKAMMKIIEAKDNHFKDQLYKTKIARKESVEWMHLCEEEKLKMNELELRLSKEEKLKYYYSAASAAIGSLLTWLIL